MSRQRQALLSGLPRDLNLKVFGGSLLKGNPRHARPVAIKRPMHLVMRSTLATGKLSFLNPQRAQIIDKTVHRLGRELGVRIYRYANSGNHLHLVVKARSRRSLSSYLRAVSGLIARITLKAERGRAFGKKFWDARPFSRILDWGREYQGACQYVVQNTLEALGFIPYTPRPNRSRSP